MSSPASPSKSITLGHNTVAGYVAQIIGATINLIFIPLYIHFLGAEAYGLVGFVAVLYAGLTFLDVGLSATLAREMARFRGGEYSAREIGKLIGTFEKIFAGMAIAFAVGVAIFSGFLARDWFKVHHLDPVIVQQAVCLMGLVVAVRWSLSFYRSGMLGLERIVWINVVSISASFVYCAVVLVILIFWPDVRLFFVCQLLAGVTELFIVRAALQNHLGRDAAITGFSRQILYEYGKFSLSVALVSSLWVAVMQTDRLVLSNVLPLQEFGYFVVATSAAFGVTLLYGPIGQPYARA